MSIMCLLDFYVVDHIKFEFKFPAQLKGEICGAMTFCTPEFLKTCSVIGNKPGIVFATLNFFS